MNEWIKQIDRYRWSVNVVRQYDEDLLDLNDFEINDKSKVKEANNPVLLQKELYVIYGCALNCLRDQIYLYRTLIRCLFPFVWTH